jgi:hypothetical protein
MLFSEEAAGGRETGTKGGIAAEENIGYLVGCGRIGIAIHRKSPGQGCPHWPV